MDKQLENYTNEKRVDSKILPELYQVSDMGRVKRKSVWLNRQRTRTAFDGTVVKEPNGYQTKENIIALQELNTWYLRADLRYMVDNKPFRKSIPVHKLVFCSFHKVTLDIPDIWHHNGILTDNRLENLYPRTETNAMSNRKLAYRLLDLYKQWVIQRPEWYDMYADLDNNLIK